jgi:TPR repeat protein
MPPAPLLARLLRSPGTAAMLTLGGLAAQPAWAAPTCLAASAPHSPTAQDRAFAAALFDYVEGRWPQAQHKFEALARKGHAAAQYNLAVMHARAEARPASAKAAEQGFERAAECGFVTAMFALGEWFDSPQRGSQRQRALQWYLKAAEAGSVDGQMAVATAHLMGRGTPADSAQAAHWYRKAATAGDVGGQYILASLYERGDGVSQDLRLARYWYEQAARQGDEAAPAKLAELAALEAPTAPPSPSGGN